MKPNALLFIAIFVISCDTSPSYDGPSLIIVETTDFGPSYDIARSDIYETIQIDTYTPDSTADVEIQDIENEIEINQDQYEDVEPDEVEQDEMEQKDAEVEDDVPPQMITISIQSDPPEANVVIGDEGIVCVTPCWPVEIEAGTHHFEVSKEGYQTKSFDQAIWEDGFVLFFLLDLAMPEIVPVFVSSVPDEALVVIDDGEMIVTTNVTVDLEEGYHKFLFQKPGYDSKEVVKEIEPPADTVMVHLAQQQQYYWISVTSSPPGATAVVDNGEAQALTPFALELVEGLHVFEFNLDGYVTQEQIVDITEGISVVHADMEIVPVNVSVTSTPTGAAVLIDGDYIGVTDFLYDMTSGLHTFEYVLDGYVTEVVEYDVDQDNYTVHADLVMIGPDTVTVTITSNPSGATVVVDEIIYTGIAPFDYSLLSGSHTFDFSLDGYEPQTVETEISEDNKTVHAEMVEIPPQLVSVDITSNPSGATVIIDDGVHMQDTPFSYDLLPGVHKFDYFLAAHVSQILYKNISDTDYTVHAEMSTVPPDPIMVSIDSDPQGATVVIDNGAYTDVTPFSYNLPPMSHVFAFSLDDYQDQALIEVISDQNNSVFATLNLITIPTTITSDPSGVTVVIDNGDYEDMTPLVYNLTPGSHTFDFDLYGYEPQSFSQDIDEVNNTVHADMVEIPPQPVTVTITSNPPGATVSIGSGVYSDVTPFAYDLLPGTHSFDFSLDGYEPQNIIQVINDQNNTVHADLIQLPITVNVTSNPVGATVIIDSGVHSDVTPFVYDLLPGLHTFDYVLTDYEPQTVEQTIDAANNSVHADLVPIGPQPVTVTVTSEPPDATVIINDGEYMDTTPFDFDMLPATHKFQFILVGYEQQTIFEDISDVNMSVHADLVLEATVTVTFMTSPIGASISIDGSPTGEVTPKVMPVSPGMHTFEFAFDGYENCVKDQDVNLSNYVFCMLVSL